MQLTAGLAGLLFLPVLLAAVLDAMGAFRAASTMLRPPRELSDHVVVVGLGKLGTRVLGVMPVERGVLLFTAVDVRDHPELVGRTVAAAFHPGQWRVIARDTTAPGNRRSAVYGSSTSSYGSLRLFQPELDWHLHPGYLLRPEDRVVLATTRAGFNILLGRDRRRAPGPRGR
ncbi:hypothetical protein [Kitasatospora purpeofusca]|uniref:hypothetical protein n=1 Tax=Kitasatospora purpeofusca TaxID=67352 RepID=UPI002251B11C|nr:hypothetical protein [Kitasatospora purpeofusca]MCX4755726.1 hypothetical protein [Kitasatospora purpeofusca]WSR36412.1 hypothetical protein OG715_38955 [Kitasatospora purpeofusca]